MYSGLFRSILARFGFSFRFCTMLSREKRHQQIPSRAEGSAWLLGTKMPLETDRRFQRNQCNSIDSPIDYKRSLLTVGELSSC